MKKKNRGFFFLLVTGLFLILTLITFLGAIAPWVDVNVLPAIQLIPSFLTFFLPVFILTFFYYFKKSVRWMAVSLAAIFCCIWVAGKDVVFRNQSTSKSDGLKIASFNVGTFDFNPEKIDTVAALIRIMNPDVISLQEFRNHKLDGDVYSLDYLKKKLEMPFAAFVHLPIHIHGAVLFSRYPIVAIDTLFLPQREINSGILATIETPMGKIGVGNVHLSSFQASQTLDENEKVKDKFQAILDRVKIVLPLQQEKVDLVLEKTRQYPYPLVIAGDFNSSPHTRIGYQFRRRFKDSFAEAGKGLGWTYPLAGPVGLRIDYQYFTNELHAVNHKIFTSRVSDHFPIQATYHLVP
ncbi:MAG: endonuclease/exonuclease/phosphatase family protein [Bacteroidia bacterium]|nr:endonuclease/exonuclease/phosphatase family protein [Bacteroidia bacterium]